MDRSEPTRPICYLAVRDHETRSALEAELTRRGWRVVVKPSGFHLLEDLAGTILGDQPQQVDLVVVEDRLPGCRGSSIAQGLAELGIDIPVAVVDPVPATAGVTAEIADHVELVQPQLAS